MSTAERTYLDYAASTPVDSRVVAAMAPYWSDVFAHPGGLHTEARQADAAVVGARASVAKYIHARPDGIIFTSGSTESNALAIRSVLDMHADLSSAHVIASVIEHTSILSVLRAYEERGLMVTYVDVNTDGVVDPLAVDAVLRPETVLVTIIHASNEIGTRQPIKAISNSVHAHNPDIVMHTDASQSMYYDDIDVGALGVDMLTCGAQKMYGPKGVGALYVSDSTRKRITVTRSGTSFVSGIVGFAEACRIAAAERDVAHRHVVSIRDYCIEQISHMFPEAAIHGSKTDRLPHIVSVGIPGIETDFIIMQLDQLGFAIGGKSACLSGNDEGSYVVAAIDQRLANSSVRLSFGTMTTKEDVDRLVHALHTCVSA